MSLLYGVAGFGAGILVGIGATLAFLKWKMKSQLGHIEKQMEAMDDMFEDLEDQSS